MAYYNHQQYPPQGQQQPPPPVQTQNLNPHQQQRPFSPQNYQQSPTAMSPTMGGGFPPNKRPRLSPNPQSPAPYQTPYGAGGASFPPSPYTGSPQTPGFLSLPTSPHASMQQPPSFHHPQPYAHQNGHQPAPQNSMPPPKAPYNRANDNMELEKANARDLDVNNISDVLTGSGIDLRAEEDNLLHSYRQPDRAASATSPHASFNNWGQQGSHGAFQGSGALSQEMTEDQHRTEFLKKHADAARILNESAQQPLTDPFLAASVLRHRIAKRAYEYNIQINVDGLFDKIPENKPPQDITRTSQAGANGEQIVGLEAASLLNQSAPLVEILTLVSLAAENRVRTIVEDSFALAQGRQNTSHGIIPPQMLDIATVREGAEQARAPAVNILKTPWEAPDSAVSPTTATKGLPNAARLPTPPSEAPATPQPTWKNVNHVAKALEKRVEDDYKWEQERLRKRAKRQAGASATQADAPATPVIIPAQITKKELAAVKKQNQSETAVFSKANETASMALGKKKKYSWMTGGGGGGGSASGASTPRPAVQAGASGAATPAAQAQDKNVNGLKKRTFGEMIERKDQDTGVNIQLRDLIHVLENDGKEKKTLAVILARQKTTTKDGKLETTKSAPATSGRP